MMVTAKRDYTSVWGTINKGDSVEVLGGRFFQDGYSEFLVRANKLEYWFNDKSFHYLFGAEDK